MKAFSPLFRHPEFEDEDQNRVAQFLNAFILACTLICVPVIIICIFYGWWRSLQTISLDLLILLLAYFLLRKKQVQLAALCTFSALLGTTLFLSFYGDGIHDIVITLLPLSFILASFLLARIPYLIFSTSSILALGVIVTLRQYYYMPDIHGDDFLSEFLVVAFNLIATAWVVRRLTSDLFRHVEKTQEQGHRLSNIFNNVLDVYFEIDQNSTFLEISPSVSKLTGHEPADLLGKPIASICLSATCSEAFMKQISDVQSVNNYEMTLMHKNGESIYCSVNASLITENDDKVKIVGSIRDISDKHLLEAQLIQSQKMESVGTLAGGIAHDFNNLLTAIGGHVDFAESKAGATPDVLEDLEVIRSAVNRAEHLTQQILAFSRKQVHQPEVLNINDVIRGSEKMFRRLIGEDIRIDLITADNLPNIKADPNQLEQILLNLLVNARDAIYDHPDKSHEKVITVKTGLQYLDETYVSQHIDSRVGNHIYLAVADTGIGMDEEIQSKIFDPFFTTKSKGKGTGLGLSTVIGIVKQNHGSLFVYSEPNQGSLFRIYWPPTDETNSSVKNNKKRTSTQSLQGSENILFVEDSEDVRVVGCDALMDFGYNVKAAESGEAALEIIESQDFQIDLLITDLVMPGMNGKELYGHVSSTIPGVKVLFMSGYADDRILKDGVIDTDLNFLHKPFSMIGLVEKVREILDG